MPMLNWAQLTYQSLLLKLWSLMRTKSAIVRVHGSTLFPRVLQRELEPRGECQVIRYEKVCGRQGR